MNQEFKTESVAKGDRIDNGQTNTARSSLRKDVVKLFKINSSLCMCKSVMTFPLLRDLQYMN